MLIIIFCRFDKKRGGGVTNENTSQPVLPTQQFGVTLKSINEYYKVEIPPIVKQCIEYLDTPDGNELNHVYLKYSINLIVFSFRDRRTV